MVPTAAERDRLVAAGLADEVALAADVTMLIGNGYLPGHAEHALSLLRTEPGVRGLFEARLADSRSSERSEPGSRRQTEY